MQRPVDGKKDVEIARQKRRQPVIQTYQVVTRGGLLKLRPIRRDDPAQHRVVVTHDRRPERVGVGLTGYGLKCGEPAPGIVKNTRTAHGIGERCGVPQTWLMVL